jgi:hypothetical protein
VWKRGWRNEQAEKEGSVLEMGASKVLSSFVTRFMYIIEFLKQHSSPLHNHYGT